DRANHQRPHSGAPHPARAAGDRRRRPPLPRHQRRGLRRDHRGFLELTRNAVPSEKARTALRVAPAGDIRDGAPVPGTAGIPRAPSASTQTEIGQMAVNTKRVFYVKYLAHQSYLDTIAKRPDIRLDRLENDSAPAAVEPVLAAAHAYQI